MEQIPVRSIRIAAGCLCLLLVTTMAPPAGAYSLLSQQRHVLKKDPDHVSASNNTWSYDSGGSPASRTDVEREFLAAMSTWNQLSDSRWQFNLQGIGDSTGMSHTTSDTFHDLAWYSEAGTLLAATSVSFTKRYQSGGQDIRFNNYYNWSFDGSPGNGQHDFQTVALHELGHVLGSHHSQSPTTVMYGTITEQQIRRQLTPDDEDMAQQLYGSKVTIRAESIPPNMVFGDEYEIQFVVDTGDGRIRPTGTALNLAVSIVGDALLSVSGGATEWDSLTLTPPGLFVDNYLDNPVLTSHHLVRATKNGFVENDEHRITLHVAPQSGSQLDLRYRVNYIDDSSHQSGANGNSAPYRAFGDLHPRTTSDPGTIQDQQGFAAFHQLIPLGESALDGPTDLQVIAVSAGEIGLIWSDNSPDEDGFSLERRIGLTGPWLEIVTLPAESSAYQNSGLATCTRYYYRVRAYNLAGLSNYSNDVNAKTLGCPPPPESPTGLTAQAASASEIDLSWVDESAFEDGFVLERSPLDFSSWQQVALLPANTTSHRDGGLLSCTDYRYRVYAFNGQGDSDYSPEAQGASSGVAEILCDGLDQDCDGLDATPDGDNDGVDACDVGDANNPDGRVADCDDADPNSYPGAPEICDNRDNDCDGVVDEGPDWLELAPSVAPPSRSAHAMTYDPLRAVTMLFGGFDVFAGSLDESWSFDGANWSLLTPPVSPPGRHDHVLVYDAARDRIVLFGGFSVNGRSNETWEWDGTSWHGISPAGSPPPLDRHAAAYDLARQSTVVFGGIVSPAQPPSGSTWSYDGTGWSNVSPSFSPAPRSDHALAYDAERELTVLFGGQGTSTFNDTWEWDGTSWFRRFPQLSPPARKNHALLYDSTRQVVVLFGGRSPSGSRYDDTWEWDGTNWTAVFPDTVPNEREELAVAYDSGRRVSVMYGGQDGVSFSDTWEYGAALPELCNGIDDDCDGAVDEMCSDDEDGDGIDATTDNCPADHNPDQSDLDLDGLGDVCDVDLDGDGFDNGDDCAPTLAGVGAEPGPIGATLYLTKNGGVMLSWTRGLQGHASNVYRGSFGGGEPFIYNESCYSAENPDRLAFDGSSSTPGHGHYYLVSARNVCGESRSGVSSSAEHYAPQSCGAESGDADGDSVPDLADDCPLLLNPDQIDVDRDFVGDPCDSCLDEYNPSQSDHDADALGDACDDCTDLDGDGLGDPEYPQNSCPTDSCPFDPENDIDGDGVCGDADNCRELFNPDQADVDYDRVGDVCDPCPQSSDDSC